MTPTVSSSKTKPTSSRTWEDNFIGTRHSTLSPNKNTARTIASSTQPREHSPREATTVLWKATLLVTNSNLNKFYQLRKGLHINSVSGDTDRYPNTFNGAYNRLNQYKSYGQTTVADTQGTSFDQKGCHDSTRGSDSGRDDDAIQEAPPRFADRICSVCGETGHRPNP
jgi:hypothetical protein